MHLVIDEITRKQQAAIPMITRDVCTSTFRDTAFCQALFLNSQKSAAVMSFVECSDMQAQRKREAAEAEKRRQVRFELLSITLWPSVSLHAQRSSWHAMHVKSVES